MTARRVLVVGATSWGCTLAIQFIRAGVETALLCRTDAEAERLSVEREHRRLLPGIELPAVLRILADPADAAAVDAVLFAVPAQRLWENARRVLAQFPGSLPPLISACKGLEVRTERRMTEVLRDEAQRCGPVPPLAALSGPNLAREVARGQPATTVVASEDAAFAAMLREMLMTATFRVYTNVDVVGVEMGGALKNIVALGVGIGDGLNVGENGRAALMTRGLAEMARLGVAVGARPLTFTGLAGLGDLIVTSVSRRTRNHYVGEQLGLGRPLDEILGQMVHVAEGVETTRAARALARRLGVDMPIVEATARVLFEGQRPTDAIHALMTRAAQDELATPSSPS